MFWRSNLFVLLGALVFLGGCANPFRDFPNKGSKEYRLSRAQDKLDHHKFDEVIDDLEPLFGSDPDDPAVVYLGVCAYAGRAGLRVLTLFTDIANGIESKGLFEILAEHFVPTAAEEFDLADVTALSDISSIADIESAKTIIENYGARAADRNSDINYMAFFVYLSRIGITLNRYAYDTDTGVLRTNFKACRTTVDPAGATTGIPNDAVDLVMTSLPRVIETAGYVFSSGSSPTSDLPTSLPFDAICATEPNNVNCLATRTLIAVSKDEQDSAIGLGTGEPGCLVVSP